MNEMEEYFRKNRNAFDTESPPPGAWDRIDRSIRSTREPVIRRLTTRSSRLRAAALVAVCFAAGFLVSQLLQNGRTDDPRAVDLSEYSMELVRVDEAYRPVIEQALNEIKYLPEYATDTAKFSIFIDQFKYLEDQNDYYLETLRDHGYNAKIVDELIRNYHYKLDLLEQLKEEIRKFNNKVKSENHESKSNLIAI